MAIEKESSGLPEIDPHRKTTKVNLSMIVAIGLFYAAMFAAVFFLMHRHSGETKGNSAPPTETAPAKAP